MSTSNDPVLREVHRLRRRTELAEAEVKRLRAVERAARVYFREFDHLIGGEYPERSDLRVALASTPPGGSDV